MTSLFPSDGHRGWGLLGGGSSATTSASTVGGNGGSLLLPALLSLPRFDVSLLLILGVLTLFYLLLIQPPHKQHRILRHIHTLITTLLNSLTWLLYRLLPASHPHPVWLVGLEVFEAPREWEVSSERYRVIAGGNFGLPVETVDFCSRILAKSGLGERTAFPRPSRSERPAHNHTRSLSQSSAHFNRVCAVATV